VAGVTGLEPAASGVTGQRSNRLSYTPMGSCAEMKSATIHRDDVREAGSGVKTLTRASPGRTGGR
jgi:hypothetical protein